MRDYWPAFVLVLSCAAAGSACRRSPAGPESLSPLAQAEQVKSAYQTEFGEDIPRPAIVDCVGADHLTSTAYLRPVGTRSELLTLFTSRDGRQVTRKAAITTRTPSGTMRVLAVLLTYDQTFSGSAGELTQWEAAQQQINTDHATFASARGFTKPIVQFDNTNVRIPGSGVDTPRTRIGIEASLSQHGVAFTDYEFIVVINVDPILVEGGFTNRTNSFIYMGNFSAWMARLTASNYTSIARAAYHHEFGHIFGWPATHDWTSNCGSGTPSFAPFISSPLLFGWEDVDGDGVPEVLDATPYGRGAS